MKKRIISLVILSSLILSQFACGTQSDVQNDTTTSDSSADTTTAVETEVTDDLPDKKFGGKTFTTLTYSNLEADYIADEANGDVINDAVYKRNQTVMERFDVELKTVSAGEYSKLNPLLTSSVMAGDDEYQLVAHHVVDFGNLATNDILVNWYDVPYIDFSKPWWSPSTVEDMTYNGVTVLAVGDYSLSSLWNTYCYFYDKKAAEDYHFEDLYEVVNEGRWTIDYITTLCKDIYQDLNGDGQRDGEDYYGLTSTLASPIDTYLWACGNKVFTKTDDGKFEYTYNNERTVEIVEKLYKMCYETDGITVDRPQYKSADNYKHYYALYSFNDNLTAMIPGVLNFAVQFFRDRSTEYGILPYPKLDEAQDRYYTMVGGSHAALGIPKTVSDLEFVGIITEALNAESHKIVFPAYYEIALKVKYSYDDESVKMLDMIVDSRVFDFGFIYDSWKGASFLLETLIGGKSSDFASFYAKRGESVEAHYSDILEYYDKLAEK